MNNPYEEARKLYNDDQRFYSDIFWFIQNGVLLSTPEFFFMIITCNSDSDMENIYECAEHKCCDAWYVHLACGAGKMADM